MELSCRLVCNRQPPHGQVDLKYKSISLVQNQSRYATSWIKCTPSPKPNDDDDDDDYNENMGTVLHFSLLL